MLGVLTILNFGVMAPTAAAAPRDPPLLRVRDVRLPGGTTRFDYQAIDAPRRLLYLAHLGDSTVDVIDLDADRVSAVVPDIANAHGIAVASDLQRVYASATGANQLVTIDASTNRVIARAPTGDFPDGVAFDADHGRVFVSNKDAGTITAVDVRTGQPSATVALGGEVGNVAYDHADQLLWASALPPDRLVAIDPVTGALARSITLGGCDGAHGVYVDALRQRAFVACERNRRMLTVDLARGTVTGRFNVGVAPDVIAYDAGLGRLYLASESGVVTTFETAGDAITKLGDQRIAATAHSVGVDPATHRVLVPLEDVHGHPALRIMRPSG